MHGEEQMMMAEKRRRGEVRGGERKRRVAEYFSHLSCFGNMEDSTVMSIKYLELK